jgi:hypothetical protein
MRKPIQSGLIVEGKALIGEFSCTRDLFTTPQGLLGLGLRSLKNGDELWLVAGSDVPILLRREAEKGYQVIGEAYVHGIMHGESLADLSSLHVETITLI